MAFIAGQHECVTFRNLKIWAERGLVHIEDQRNGDYKVIFVKDMLARMDAINNMLKGARRGPKSFAGLNTVDEIQSGIEQLVGVVRLAQHQGEPSNEAARRDYVRRRPQTFVMPGDKALTM